MCLGRVGIRGQQEGSKHEMTLVILFEEAAVMVGDLMASSYDREQFDEARIKVRKKDRTPFYSAYPLQKIIRIQDRFHIAWSGSLLDAEKIINYARDLPWPPMPFSGLFPFGGFGIGGFASTFPKPSSTRP
jgi:hypothetical protein